MAEHEERKHGGEAREHEKRAEGGKAHTEMEMSKPEYAAHGGHPRRQRRARGGKTESPVNIYNAKGSPEVEEAEDEKEEFKHGGAKHKERKHGGHAEGEHAKHRADKAPRGHRKHGGHAEEKREHHAAGGRAGGSSPWSSATKTTMDKGSPASRGHEGQEVPSEPE